ncbi:hypothetical protein D7S70_08150 [Ralstonia pickettii]|nr:hypothetical protein [Ralstonia pickettii]MBB0097019.1 hypothetical protein [Ralstonia pickettii]MBB0107011.1 hypothetical protein [Ralstonia pickettii]MBB0127792.1 hypothetical protein [Ralstonia pickettii]MBB0160711.1 hypothetical protein [Ralstonia pickettii]
MKLIFAFIASLATSALVAAATLSPVQLLNPTGSASGQTIVSNGPSSAPTWQSVPPSGLSAQAANTVLGNGTASTAPPTALTMPSCSASTNALLWTSGTGFSCNSGINAATLGGATFAAPGAIGGTTAGSGAFTALSASGTVSGAGFTSLLSPYAPLASPALTGTPTAPTATGNTNTTQVATTAFVEGEFASPPTAGFGSTTRRPVAATTISATSTITPSSTAGIVGTTTNDSANAGSVGEYVTNSTTNTNLSNGVSANLTSISLSAGDWDIGGNAYFHPGASTVITGLGVSISTTSAISNGLGGLTYIQANYNTGGGNYLTTPTVRLSLSATTTVYLVGIANFGTSTMQGDGMIRARRVR